MIVKSNSYVSHLHGDDQNRSRKKILSAQEYDRICKFIQHFHGLAIDCELELDRRCEDIERLTLKSILQAELGNRLRSQHWRYEAQAEKYLQSFNEQAAVSNDATLLVKMATAEAMSPAILCRNLLQAKYKFAMKSQLTRLLKFPHLIDEPCLAANVRQCLMSDSQDGPLTDLKRRILGEEYEFRLKTLAKASGMHYYDETELRRMGFDKTPDLKLILPCLYKGTVVNWIESKATFGDIKTHKWNVQQQLASYCNRFGPGIVIYWFGYHENTPDQPCNANGITVLADFPDFKDFDFLDFADNGVKTERRADNLPQKNL